MTERKNCFKKRAMLRPIFLVIAIFIMTHKTEAQQSKLKKHRWQNRILVLKTDSKQNDNFVNQLQELKQHKVGLIERKLVLYTVIEDMVYFDNFKSKDPASYKLNDLDELSDIFGSEDYEIILIGLDGGIKVRDIQKTSIKQLFEIIDVMPMRRRELKNKGK